MDQADLDARIRAYYAQQFDEADRLAGRSAQGRLELERVRELVGSRIPPGSRVLDVGGATGVHAAWLADAGHDVVLVDPVPEQVEVARRHATFEAHVGDARDLAFADASVDVVLLLGPLYHLAERADRLMALTEARRVASPGGWVFAAAIPRLARLATLSSTPGLPSPAHAELLALLEHGHAPAWGRFPGGHFHTADELEDELATAGLTDVRVCAVEGPDGLALERVTEPDDALHEAALRVVRTLGHLPGARELSNHLMGIARVP